jgi:hypothetical protein
LNVEFRRKTQILKFNRTLGGIKSYCINIAISRRFDQKKKSLTNNLTVQQPTTSIPMAPCTSVDLMVIIAHLRGEGLSTYSIELERLTPQLTLTPRPLHDGCIFLIHYSKVLGFFAKIRAGCGKNNH